MVVAAAVDGWSNEAIRLRISLRGTPSAVAPPPPPLLLPLLLLSSSFREPASLRC